MSYTQMVTSAGTGGVAMGQGNSFGQRYAYYVASMRARISANWLMATVSPNIASAPRAYLKFQILRDGTVTNVQITQSSGIAEVDRSALRAILASSPLPPLPSDYSGSSVDVEFYFDFHRQ
jgi:TonB family protein